MLAARNFQGEGFLKLYFLWAPQGYSKSARLLDDPAVRNHAHGRSGVLKGYDVGPRRIYTHWPSWYSVPYGLFAKLGVFDKFVFQVFAILISLTGLIFFYLFLKNEFNATLAFLTTFLICPV